MATIIGQSLGRYHILEQLGEGGMATVYKAYDTHLERDVAVKIIRKSAFGSEVMERMLKRFEREAKALSKLTHPNIVGVIDYGDYEGSPYIVMEYLPGGTLKQRLGKPIPWQEAARLLLPIARALQFAHSQNIVHRDVKPSNILITLSGEPMLTDFGIAKILESEETDTLTGTGIGVGTPEYMAPEQWTGKVTLQSDIYSLGVVFYEMVAGRKPYVADTPAAVLLKQATEPLPRPAQVVPGLPDDVEKVLLKALARQPEDRYSDMAAFADGLDHLLARQLKTTKVTAFAKAIPPEAEPVADSQETVMQEETNATRFQEAVKDELPSPSRPAKPKSSPVPIQPPQKKKIVWWLRALGISGVLIIGCLLIAVLMLKPLLFPTETEVASTPTTTAYVPTTAVSLPVLQGTPLPEKGTPISVGNVEGIRELARWGKGTVNDLVWSPDGRLLVVASSLGTYFYDPQTLEEVSFFETTYQVRSVAFSLDGTLLAMGSDDGIVRLWRVSDGALLRTLEGDTDRVSWVVFSPDGQALATKSNDAMRLWRVSDGMLLWTLDGYCMSNVAFSPDGQTLASASGDNLYTVQIRRVSDGALLRTLEGHTDYVFSVAFSPDGTLLASASGDKTVRLWRLADGMLLRTLEGHTENVFSVAFSPDGQTLASGSYDHTIRLWQVSDGSLLHTLQGHTNTVISVSFSPDGQTLASESWDNTVRLWRVSDGTLLRTLQGHTSAVTSVTFSPDGQMLASGLADGTVRLWQISESSLLRTLQGHTSLVWSLVFSPNGQTLASGSWDNTVRLWRVSDGTPLRTLQGPENYSNCGDFSPDWQTLAWGSEHGEVELWRVSDNSLLNTMRHKAGVTNMTFSPDGQMLASASYDKTINLWRVSDGALLHTLQGHTRAVTSVAFSPDGTLLASTSDDKTVRLWRLADGMLLRTLEGHTDYVFSVAFSPDGQTLASGSYDHTIRLWQVSDGSLLSTLQGHTGSVVSLAFSPDGTLLASASVDGTVRLWGVAP